MSLFLILHPLSDSYKKGSRSLYFGSPMPVGLPRFDQYIPVKSLYIVKKQAVRVATQYVPDRLAVRTLRPTSSPQPTRLTPAAPSAMNIRDRQSAARSGWWRRNWSRRYTSCSDLNSHPKRPGDLDLWPLTLKVVSESRVTWATPVSILVFLGLSVLDLGPMYATNRRQTSDKSIT